MTVSATPLLITPDYNLRLILISAFSSISVRSLVHSFVCSFIHSSKAYKHLLDIFTELHLIQAGAQKSEVEKVGNYLESIVNL